MYVLNYISPSLAPPTPSKQTLSHRNYFNDEGNLKIFKTEINRYNIFQIFIFGIGLVSIFWLFLLHLCNHVRYVAFNTNLNLYSMKKTILILPQCTWMCLPLIMLGLLLNECEKDQILLFIVSTKSYFGSVFDLIPSSCKPYLVLCPFSFFLYQLHRLLTFYAF